MTIEQAEVEYARLLSKRATPSELATGYRQLCDIMDKLRMGRNNLCDNDEKEGEPYP